MVFLHRQLVAGLTAASVLLCSVVCACGGTEHQPIGPAVAAAVGEAGPHCHGSSNKPAGRHRDGHGKAPSGDNDHRSCRHCQSTATLYSGGGGGGIDFKPLAQGFAALPFVLVGPFARPATAADPRSVLGDLSPPGRPTLLSLHCALNA